MMEKKPWQKAIEQAEIAANEMQDQVKKISIFAQIIDCHPVPTAVVDLEMNYVMANIKWCEYFGKKINPGENHYEAFPTIPQEKPEWLNIHQDVLANGATRAGKEKFDNHTFEWICSPLMHDSEVVGMLMVIIKNL